MVALNTKNNTKPGKRQTAYLKNFRNFRIKLKRIRKKHGKFDQKMPKSKLNRKKTKVEPVEELFYDFRPSRVKLKRIKLATTSEISKADESESPAPSTQNTAIQQKEGCTVTKTRARAMTSRKAVEEVVDSTPAKITPELKSQETVIEEQKRSTITRTRAREIGSKKVKEDGEGSMLTRARIQELRIEKEVAKEVDDSSSLAEITQELRSQRTAIKQREGSNVTKSKMKRKKGKAQPQEELFYDFRPSRVKLKRITLATTSEISKANESESQASQKDRCSYYRNPKLALTKRRAQELRLQKAALQEGEGSSAIKTRDREQSKERQDSELTKERIQELRSEKMGAKKGEDSILTEERIQELRSEKTGAKEREDFMLTEERIQELRSQISAGQEKKNSTITKRGDHEKEARELENPNAILSEKQPNIGTKKTSRFNRKKQKRNKKENNEKHDIYEFLSQSQESNSNSDAEKRIDPAEDIIQKLIKEGKVAVTKNYKGKPVIVHRNRTTRKPKNKKINKIKCSALKNNTKQVRFEREFPPTHDVIFESDDHLDNAVINIDSIDDLMPIPMSVAPLYPNETSLNMNSVKSTPMNQASFSNLARSVLMQQTNQMNSTRRTISDISTPLRRAPAELQRTHMNLSPIPKTTTFNKEKTLLNLSLEPENCENDVSYVPSLPSEHSNTSPKRVRTQQDNQRQEDSLSSFSSNDSNAENRPPSPSFAVPTVNDNPSLRLSLNSRRTLPNRQPLRPLVNIIDVVELPPYLPPIDKAKEPNSKLFGFEEYLDEDPNALHEDENKNNDNNNNKKSNNNTTKNTTIPKLRKRLRKLRPMVQRLSDCKRSTITKNIFDDHFDMQSGGQRDIRNMLCSTMCEKPDRGGTVSTAVGGNSSDSDSDSLPSTSRKNDAVDLFGDPESTFNQNKLHRTYERPIKRKRKLVHQYSAFLDSEDDESEEEEAAAHGKKRKHREESPNQELDAFVSQFNSMIKEAEDYELIVE